MAPEVLATTVAEPLVIHGIGTRAEREQRVAELFRLVGLLPEHRDRFPPDPYPQLRQRVPR